MTRRGFTLIEVAVAVAVLATAGVALERLVVRSLATIDDDAARARTLLVARAALADAALHPPVPGTTRWSARDGIEVIRTITPTAHPALHEVTVRAEGVGGRDPSEITEVFYAPGR